MDKQMFWLFEFFCSNGDKVKFDVRKFFTTMAFILAFTDHILQMCKVAGIDSGRLGVLYGFAFGNLYLYQKNKELIKNGRPKPTRVVDMES